MASKLNVKVGDQVAITFGTLTNETIVNTATVQSVSATGRVTVLQRGRRDVKSNYDVYDKDGWPRGTAVGRIRPLREDEDAEAIMAAKDAAKQAREDEARAAHEAAQAKRAADKATCLDWVNQNARMSIVSTINTALHVVELPIKDQPCTLVLRFEKDAIQWGGKTTYRVSIMVNHTRGDRMEGGITSGNGLDQPNAYEVAAEWLSSWVGVSYL